MLYYTSSKKSSGVIIMLVSLMARLNATSQMHNAQWNMMQNNMRMMNMCRNLPSFMGNPMANMSMLAEADKQFAVQKIQNETLYQLAAAQEKAAAQMLAQEIKDNKISYIA